MSLTATTDSVLVQHGKHIVRGTCDLMHDVTLLLFQKTKVRINELKAFHDELNE